MSLNYGVGAPLARLELQAALKPLSTRLPDLGLTGDASEYHPKNVFRYLKKLNVTF